MRRLSTFLFCLSLIGCGRDAQKISAKNSFLPTSETQALSIKSEQIDSNIRGITLLFPPAKEEMDFLSDFHYTPRQDAYQGFVGVQKLLFKRDPVFPYTIKKELNGDEKLSQFAEIVLGISRVKDDLFRTERDLQAGQAQVNMGKAGFLSTIKCYYPEGDNCSSQLKTIESTDPTTGEITISQDASTPENTKTAADCESLSKFNFLDSTGAVDAQRAGLLQMQIGKCKAIEGKGAELAGIEAKVKGARLKAGSGMVLELFTYLQYFACVVKDPKAYSPANPALKKYPEIDFQSRCLPRAKFEAKSAIQNVNFSSTKERPNGAASTMTFKGSGENLEVDSMNLYLNVGNGGFERFSTEVGNVTDLKFYRTKHGSRNITFTMHLAAGAKIIAKMSPSFDSKMGFRLAGSAEGFLPNGIVRKGFMKMEFDTK